MSSAYPALIHNVGDIVTVRKDLQGGVVYNGLRTLLEMTTHCGSQLTILELKVSGSGEIPYYTVKESPWCWTDAMFEDDAVEPVSLDVGDIL